MEFGNILQKLSPDLGKIVNAFNKIKQAGEAFETIKDVLNLGSSKDDGYTNTSATSDGDSGMLGNLFSGLLKDMI